MVKLSLNKIDENEVNMEGCTCERKGMEYLESKFSPEEAAALITKGCEHLFGNYVTPEEYAAFWARENRLRSGASIKESLALIALTGVAITTIVGVVKGVQWLTSWRIEEQK